jgi:hypothetical protein
MGAIIMAISWDIPLSYEITPKSGPMRRLATLDDVRSAMVHDLPPGSTKKPHWLRAGQLVVAAVEDGSASPRELREVTEALVEALDAEGWLNAAPRTAEHVPAAGPSQSPGS